MYHCSLSGSRRLLENGTLRLENLQTHHKGTYICIAQNSAGTVIGHVLLSVLGKKLGSIYVSNVMYR